MAFLLVKHDNPCSWREIKELECCLCCSPSLIPHLLNFLFIILMIFRNIFSEKCVYVLWLLCCLVSLASVLHESGIALPVLFCSLTFSHIMFWSFIQGFSVTVVHFLFVVVQWLSRVRLFATPWTAARQASLSTTLSLSLPKLKSLESIMLSNHLIFCHPPSPLTLKFFQHQSLFQFINTYIIFNCKIHHELFTHSPVDGFCSSFKILFAITN